MAMAPGLLEKETAKLGSRLHSAPSKAGNATLRPQGMAATKASSMGTRMSRLLGSAFHCTVRSPAEIHGAVGSSCSSQRLCPGDGSAQKGPTPHTPHAGWLLATLVAFTNKKDGL